MVLPAPQATLSSTHAAQGAAAWMASSSSMPANSGAMADCDDDDDQDDSDSVPPAPERTNDDLIFGRGSIDVPPGGLPSAALLRADAGIRPARGHARAPEQPPRSV
jgi:hypothetical protein